MGLLAMMPGEIKTRNGSIAYTLKGVADSLIEAICPVYHLRSKRSTDQSPNDFVRGYKVSVSNDGTTFGNQTEDVYIFDSTCQAYDNASGEIIFTLKDGHCYISGGCVSNGTLSMSQHMVCDTGISRFSWTPVTTQAPTTSTSTTSTSTTTAATTITTTTTTKTTTSTTQMTTTTTNTPRKEECNCVSNNTKSCSGGECVCKDGWTGGLCDNDVDECSLSNVCENKPNTTCQNTPGHYDCLCLRGFEKTNDGECKAALETKPSSTVDQIVKAKQNLQAYTIELKIDLSINSSFNLNAASTYHMLEAAAKTALSAVYQRKLGIGFKDVVILSLRPGSLIIQHAVIVTRDNFVISAMSVAIADWSRGETLQMFDAVYHVDNVKIDNTAVGTNGGNLQNFLLCESHTALQPCAEDEICVVEKDAPICKKKETHTDKSNLITIISSSVGGVLALVIVILVACLCRSKMNNRKGLNARQSSGAQNMYHDMNSTEMLERPRNKPEEGKEKTSAYNPSYDTRSITSERSYYKDGYVYYFGKK